jgi:hypothetical protein
MRTDRTILEELVRKSVTQADNMCRHLELHEFEEGERFGRYYLRPPAEGFWASYTWVEVVVLRHGVIVHGDCDTATFKGLYRKGGGPRAALYWLSGYNHSYAEEKLDRGRGHNPKDWDRYLCRAQVASARRDGYLGDDDARALYDAAYDGCTQQEWINEYFALGLDAEGCSLGEVTPWVVFSAQAVLRRLTHLLEARDALTFQARSKDWFKRAA